MLVALALPGLLYRPHRIASLSGPVDDCCCTAADVRKMDSDALAPVLNQLVEHTFFRYFQVNYERDCPFWHEEVLCTEEGGDCSVCPCPPDVIPEPWRTKRDDKQRELSGAGSSQADSAIGGCSEESGVISSEGSDAADLWMDVDDDACFVDLVENPEKYTGYGGFNATRIWMAIYKENCLSSECLEGRVLYRLMSGFHASTTAHITAYHSHNGQWVPNVDMFVWRLGLFPERITNVYFTYVLLLRAMAKAEPILREYEFETGNDSEDGVTTEMVHRLLDEVRDLDSCSSTFDESMMFQADEQMHLREEFRSKFRNISRIIDCVTCETCKIHAKLQLLGLGTGLRILLSDNVTSLSFHRTEVLAMVHSLQKFSDSLRIIDEMTARYYAAEWEAALRWTPLVLVGTCAWLLWALLA